MNNSMHISFQLKKFRTDEKGLSPIFVRLTINHQRTEFSIKRSVAPEKWLSSAGIVKGNTEEVKNLNAYLTTVRLKLQEHYRQLLEADKTITPEAIKNAYFGVTEKSKTILEAFQYHNDQLKQLINKDFSPATLVRYNTAYRHTKEFMIWKYQVSDMELKQINHQYITEFEFYLKTVCKCDHNTTMKYITNFKKIIRLCISNEWLDKNPFANYKISLREVEREFLSEEELQAIADKEFYTERLENVRDIFLFSCFTGLAYADAKKLSSQHIIMGMDGDKWIKINRTKTDTRSSIPLLPTAEAIIEKYSDDPRCKTNDRLLPVLSNQKMNAYLKEIADVCGIKKNITFHLARHTFATTVTLTNHVSLESVSKMLGHKSIKTTQHYAKILDRKVSDDMKTLKKQIKQRLHAKSW